MEESSDVEGNRVQMLAHKFVSDHSLIQLPYDRIKSVPP